MRLRSIVVAIASAPVGGSLIGVWLTSQLNVRSLRNRRFLRASSGPPRARHTGNPWSRAASRPTSSASTTRPSRSDPTSSSDRCPCAFVRASRGRSSDRTVRASPRCWTWRAASGTPRPARSRSSVAASARWTSARSGRGSGSSGHHVAEAIPPSSPVRDVVLTGKRSTLVPWMQTFDDDDRRLADDLLRRVRCEELSGGRWRRAARENVSASCWPEPCSDVRSCCCSTSRPPGSTFPVANSCSKHSPPPRRGSDDDPRHAPRRGDPADDDARGAPATGMSRGVRRHRNRADRRERDDVLRPRDLRLCGRRTVAGEGDLKRDPVPA